MIMISALFIVLLVFLFICVAFFRAMNKVRGIGPFYVIRRDIGKDYMPIFAIGFMRELGAPWRIGKGLQLRIKSHIFQIGVCRKQKFDDEVTGVLAALDGRFMEETAKDIRDWK